MAKVTLVDFTGKGRADEAWHAADMLIYTKSTRLNMTASLLEGIKAMTPEKKVSELEYMAGTIPSSWEFVDVTFLIEGVSRATAQQITRTRTASYAMQSQRVTDASEFAAVNPHPQGTLLQSMFEEAVTQSMRNYTVMVENGAALQDARGLLPMNVVCNLVAKYNLRSFVDLLKARSSLRVQGEYVDIADQMRKEVLAAWPWVAPFFADKHASAIKMLEDAARDVGITTGHGPGWAIAKAIDLLRKN